MCALAAILFIPAGWEIGEMGKNDDGHRVQHHDAHHCLRKSAMGRQAIAVRIYPAECRHQRFTNSEPKLPSSGVPLGGDHFAQCSPLPMKVLPIQRHRIFAFRVAGEYAPCRILRDHMSTM